MNGVEHEIDQVFDWEGDVPTLTMLQTSVKIDQQFASEMLEQL